MVFTRPISDEEKELVRQMRHEGASYAEIAKRCERSPHAIKQMVSRHRLTAVGPAAHAIDEETGERPEPSQPRRFSWEQAA